MKRGFLNKLLSATLALTLAVSQTMGLVAVSSAADEGYPSATLSVEVVDMDLEQGISTFSITLDSAEDVKGVYFQMEGADADDMTVEDGFTYFNLDGTYMLAYDLGGSATLTDTDVLAATIVVEDDMGATIVLTDVIVANTKYQQEATLASASADTQEIFALIVAKADKIAEIETAYADYSEADYSADNWGELTTIFTDAIAEVEGMTDKVAVQTYDVDGLVILADAIVTLAQVAQELDDAKDAKIAEIEAAYANYSEDDYSADNWSELTAIFTDAIAEVEAMTDKATVEGYEVAPLVVEADAITTLAQEAQALADAKDAKIAEVEAAYANYSEDDYSADNWSELTAIFTDAIAEVEKMTDKATVESYEVAPLVVEADAITTLAQEAQALADAKAAKIAEIEGAYANYSEDDYSADNWSELTAIFTDAVAEVEEMTDKATVESYDVDTLVALADAITTLAQEAQNLDDAKAEKIAEIEAAYANYSEDDYSADNWSELTAIFTDAIAEVEGMTDKVAVQTYDVDGLVILADAIVTLAQVAQELEDAKDAKIAEIEAAYADYSEDDYSADNWSELTAIFTDAIAEVEEMTDKATVEGYEVAPLVVEADAITTLAQEAQALADAKDAKIAEIEAAYANYSEDDYSADNWSELTAIFTDAIAEVEEMTDKAIVESYDVDALVARADAIPTEQEILDLYDLDEDGEVTNLDQELILSYYGYLFEEEDEESKYDVNGNGAVESADALMIEKYITRTVTDEADGDSDSEVETDTEV